MGCKTYIGVNGKAQEVKSVYVGVNDKATKVSKIYIGVNGKAEMAYQSTIFITPPTVTVGTYT